jgi:UPF0755 protein
MRRILFVIALLSIVTACRSPAPIAGDEVPLLTPPVVAAPTPEPPAMPVIELSEAERPKNKVLAIASGITTSMLLATLRTTKGVAVSSPPLSDRSLMDELDIPFDSSEGMFLPEIYRFAETTSDLELLRVANGRLTAELERAWAEREPNLPLKSAYELLVLASIVEKETALVSESPIIAGVFITRLRSGMRLQSDPTVIYGMGPAYAGRMTRADLRRDTPHNTYTRDGLPPTPICLPSVESIRAAAHPKVTGDIFFVLSGKRDGSHHFSKTLAEHNAAIRRYLETRRK